MKYAKNIGILTLLFIVGLGFSLPAHAMNLQNARNAGAVGERLDGYIAAVESSAEINALVEDINQKRRAEYARISKENQQPIDVVAKLAAKQIIERLDRGHYYQTTDGSWKQK